MKKFSSVQFSILDNICEGYPAFVLCANGYSYKVWFSGHNDDAPYCVTVDGITSHFSEIENLGAMLDRYGIVSVKY